MRFFTTIYVLLLAYIIAALIFWGLSLQKQSLRIFAQERELLTSRIDSVKNSAEYKKALLKIKNKKDRRTSQYLGEGLTFLIVILIGAVVVYSSIKRNIRLSRQQNNFMLAVTHELKSPIAGIKLYLQTLEKHALDEEKRKSIINQCITEVNRLNDLCTNMLIATQIEGKQYVPAKERINLSELVRGGVIEYNTRFSRHIEMNIETEISTQGDRTLLQIALNNLIENAIKYSSNKIIVSLFVNENDSCANVSVADEGPGIPEAEKRKVFQKFYRIGNEETRKTKGTGLGLYLTAKIMKQHKGRINIKNNFPNGAIFEIMLPIV
jgi:signal transduction histidine kinase